MWKILFTELKLRNYYIRAVTSKKIAELEGLSGPTTIKSEPFNDE